MVEIPNFSNVCYYLDDMMYSTVGNAAYVLNPRPSAVPITRLAPPL